MPPVLHEEAALLPSENDPPPETLEAKVDTFLRTCWLWQAGQVTSFTALALRTNSSNDLPQLVQLNSNKGMVIPPGHLDAAQAERLQRNFDLFFA